MRRYALPGLFALLLLAPLAPAAAQDERPAPRTVEEADLPPDVARRITAFFNDPETIHFTGATRIPAERTIVGDVAVLGGPLTIAGRIEGDVVVINGDVELLPGASVTGGLTVVGGEITGAEEARVGGEMIAYSARLRYERRGERIVWVERGQGRDAGRDAGRRAGRDDAWEDGREGELYRDRSGRSDFIVATGQSYNRVEGLPIYFGPVFETEGSNPLRLRAMGIFRTEDEDGPFSAPRWGYDVRLEQFVGGERTLRLGGRAHWLVDPIEDWHLTKLENGLSTFFLHRDYRDHYERRGWSVYTTLSPRESPFRATLEYLNERHGSVAAGSPWTLFHNDDPWRAQPRVGSGRLQSVALRTKFDTRSREDDPATGWYVEGTVEQAIESTLRQAEITGVTPGGPSIILPEREWDSFTRGFVDIRRYNRINPSSRLNLRLLAGGSLDGSALPPQRQHAMGGEGSLPGFPLFSIDCGARATRVDLSGSFPGAEPVVFYPSYGCDRFVLGQAEYRGDLAFHVNVGRDWDDDDDEDSDDEDSDDEDSDDEEDDEEDEAGDEGDTRWNVWDASFGWVLFADAGRGWSLDGLRDEDTQVDVGAGLLFGRLGVYFALPVTGGSRDVNFFIRLNSRF